MKRWHKWTKAEHRLLVQKFMRYGDKAIAEMLNKRFPKAYPWTDKHVEKRRNYFGLHRGRTAGQCFVNRNNIKASWDTRGRAKDGEVRQWNQNGVLRSYIKVDGVWVDLFRHKYMARPGQVVRKMKGGKIKLLTRAEHAILNRCLWMEYSPELKETVKVLNQLKNIVNGKENRRSA